MNQSCVEVVPEGGHVRRSGIGHERTSLHRGPTGFSSGVLDYGRFHMAVDEAFRYTFRYATYYNVVKGTEFRALV